MKTIVKSLLMATVLSSPILMTECSNSASSRADMENEGQDGQDSTKQQGVCPMHPEVVGKVGDTCSKCGMKLVLTNEKTADTNDYFMDFTAVPELRAGEASRLSLTPSIKGRTETVPLDIQHDKKIHLIIVSRDLSYFDHVHPELQADGSYEIRVLANSEAYTDGKFNKETRFNQAGDYVLFADYLPSGASHQLERVELRVEGAPSLPAVKYSSEKLVSNVDGYEVSLVTEGGKFFNEGGTRMAAIITKDGVEIPAGELEDFLAAKTHMVMISEDSKNYLHVHPEVTKGRLSLHTTFEVPGTFRGWLQFKTNGQVHTADFVVKVAQGKAGEHSQPAHKH